MYRPKDWDNPYDKEVAVHNQADHEDYFYTGAENVAFEAGADAMLEALCKNGERVNIDRYPSNCICQVPVLVLIPAHGVAVFIPDQPHES